MVKYEIIIPAKSELNNLKLILPKIRKQYSYNITLINKSRDLKENSQLSKICKNLNIKMLLQKSDGKGNALKEAAGLSKADILIFFDADFSHDVLDIEKIINIFKKNNKIDHIGGSRLLGGSDELFSDAAHLIRLFGSIIINIIINLKFNVSLTDSQNGLRGIKRKVFQKFDLTSSHTTIEMELVAKTLQYKLNYLEVATHEYKRLYGKSKINLFFHSWSYIFFLISIIFYKKYRRKELFYK
jgi:hypothetical protein